MHTFRKHLSTAWKRHSFVRTDTPRLRIETGHPRRFQPPCQPFWQAPTFRSPMANLATQPAGNGRYTSTFPPPAAEAVAEPPQLLTAAAVQHASERAGSRMCELAPVRRQAQGSSPRRRPSRRRSEARPPRPPHHASLCPDLGATQPPTSSEELWFGG